MNFFKAGKPSIDIGEKNTKRLFRGLDIIDFCLLFAIPLTLYIIDHFIIPIPNPFGGN